MQEERILRLLLRLDVSFDATNTQHQVSKILLWYIFPMCIIEDQLLVSLFIFLFLLSNAQILDWFTNSENTDYIFASGSIKGIVVFVFSWCWSTWTCIWTMETNGVAREWPINRFQVLGEPSVYLYHHVIIISGKIQMLSVSVQFWQGWRIYFPGKFTFLCKEISGMYVCVCIYSNSMLKFFITMLSIILSLTYIRTPLSLEDTWKCCPIRMHPHI